MDSFPRRPNRMPDFDFTAFPASVPPFQRPALIAATDGNIVIARTRTASERVSRYDVIDRRGRLVREITIPPSERIVGFGTGSGDVVSTGAGGIPRGGGPPWARRA